MRDTRKSSKTHLSTTLPPSHPLLPLLIDQLPNSGYGSSTVRPPQSGTTTPSFNFRFTSSNPQCGSQKSPVSGSLNRTFHGSSNASNQKYVVPLFSDSQTQPSMKALRLSIDATAPAVGEEGLVPVPSLLPPSLGQPVSAMMLAGQAALVFWASGVLCVVQKVQVWADYLLVSG